MIFIDYKNLLQFIIIKELTLRQARQLKILKQYKFKILYTLGKENKRVNTFSRRKDLIGDKIKIYSVILKENKNRLLGPTIELNQLLVISKNILKE